MATSPTNDAAIRWSNPDFNGDDRPIGLSLGSTEIAPPAEDNAIGITGTSYAGPNNKLDIKTLLLNATTGNLFAWGLNNPKTRQGSAGLDDSPVDIELYWRASVLRSGETVLHTVVAGTLKEMHGAHFNDDIWTVEYNEFGNALWEDVYNGPVGGEDVATAMTIAARDNGGVFVCGFTPHLVSTLGGSSGGGGSAPLTFADTDYIALGFVLQDTAPMFTPHWDPWFNLAAPNTEGVRVYNGPGPTSATSDDSPADIGVGDGGLDIWLTGRVHEPDGVGYDMATIRYAAFSPSALPVQVVRIDLPTTLERAFARWPPMIRSAFRASTSLAQSS